MRAWVDGPDSSDGWRLKEHRPALGKPVAGANPAGNETRRTLRVIPVAPVPVSQPQRGRALNGQYGAG